MMRMQVPALRRFSVFADEVFEGAAEALGERARVSGGGSKAEVRIGQRGPFDATQPLSLVLLSNLTIETEGGRAFAFMPEDRSLLVSFGGTLTEPPRAPRLRYNRVWGKTCAAASSNVGSGSISIEPAAGEVWADVFWSRVSTGLADAEIDSYLEQINAREVSAITYYLIAPITLLI